MSDDPSQCPVRRPGARRAGGTPRKLTNFKDYDVLWPSAGPEAIVFENGDDKDVRKDDDKHKRVPQVRIDTTGFAARVQPLKADAGRYSSLKANTEGVFFLAGGSGGRSEETGTVRFLETQGDKPADVAAAVRGYALSADDKKILLRQDKSFAIVDASGADGDALKSRVEAGKLKTDTSELRIEPRREWSQQFVDAWRIVRDWFYDPNISCR